MPTASLASTLYAAFRSAQSDPTALPAWGNLDTEQRAAWERVAEVARVECQPAVVGYRCACGRDHMFDAEPAADLVIARENAPPSSGDWSGMQPNALDDDLEAHIVHAPAWLEEIIAKNKADEAQLREQLTRQRDEAQRAVRDGFPATVAVIRQQRDEAETGRVKALAAARRIESETVAAIVAWLRLTTEPNDPQCGHDLAAAIDRGAWRPA